MSAKCKHEQPGACCGLSQCAKLTIREAGIVKLCCPTLDAFVAQRNAIADIHREQWSQQVNVRTECQFFEPAETTNRS